MTEYDSTTISDTQPRKNMTTMGKVDTSDLMMIIRWVMDIQCKILMNKAVRACERSLNISLRTLLTMWSGHWPLARYVKLRVAHAPGMPGTFSPSPRVSDPGMHHDTCMTHVPWCVPGSLTSGFLWSRGAGKTFSLFPAHVQPTILCIWQEAYDAFSGFSPQGLYSLSGKTFYC